MRLRDRRRRHAVYWSRTRSWWRQVRRRKGIAIIIAIITHGRWSREYSDHPPLWFWLSVCPHDKTKTTETKIAKLGTGIDWSITTPRPSMNIRLRGQRSRLGLGLGLGDRVAGVSYAPLSSAPLVIIPFTALPSSPSHFLLLLSEKDVVDRWDGC